MLYRFFCCFLFFIFNYNFCIAKQHSNPLFSKYLTPYDIKNINNVDHRKTNILDEETHITEFYRDDFWDELIPRIPKHIENSIVEYNKNVEKENFFNKENRQDAQLENIKDNILKYYLEKQVLNGFIVKTIKKTNPSLKNIDNQVRVLSGNEPIISNKKEPQTQTKTVEEPQEDFWKIDTGARTDWLRQRSKAWFNCSLFSSEAKVDLGSFSRFRYELKLHRKFQLTEEVVPFGQFQTVFLIKNEETSSLIKTNLTQNLELNYQNIINQSNNIVQLNYSFNF